MEKLADLSPPISSTSSNPVVGQVGPEVEEISVCYLFQCLNCSVSVEMSSSWVNPNGDLLSVNMDFVKNPQIEELPLPFVILCSICHRKLKKKNKSNSDALQVQGQGQHHEDQGQAEKVAVNVTVDNVGDDLRNPFEIGKIVEIILKNMKLNDLMNARLINKMWNKMAVQVLSTQSIQDKMYPKQCTQVIKVDDQCTTTTRYIVSFQDTVQLLRNSKNREIFRKFEFGFRYHENSLEFDDSTYPQILEIIDMTQPTHVTFMSDTYNPKNLDIALFTIFLHKISHDIAHLKIRLNVWGKEEFLIDEETLPVQFPQLKSLKIEVISEETTNFLMDLLKKCHFLDDLELHGYESVLYEPIDEFLPYLLTPKIAANLQKLHLSETSFEFIGHLLYPLVLSQMSLKSLIVDSSEILSEFENQEPFLKFRQLNRFLTSQSGSLEEFTIHFNFYIYNENIYDYVKPYSLAEPQPQQMADQVALVIPRLQKLTNFKLLYDWSVLPRKHDICPNMLQKVKWPARVLAISLPEVLPSLKKIRISYDFAWKLSFMTGKPCETVEELVVEKYSKGNFEFYDLVCLFPNIKYLKMEFRDYGLVGEMQADFNSLKGWSTLKKIEIKFYQSFPENFNFRGISSLLNLDHLYLQQPTKTQDQNEIHLNFTPLFNMEKLSKLVIQNIKISEEVIEALFKKFPKLDYTF